MKTAMQLAIEKLLALRSTLEAQFKLTENDYSKAIVEYEIKGLTDSIRALSEFLPTEQEQIEQAYNIGFADSWLDQSTGHRTSQSAEQYYTETFKTDK